MLSSGCSGDLCKGKVVLDDLQCFFSDAASALTLLKNKWLVSLIKVEAYMQKALSSCP
jgi:hypothetical protein